MWHVSPFADDDQPDLVAAQLNDRWPHVQDGVVWLGLVAGGSTGCSLSWTDGPGEQEVRVLAGAVLSQLVARGASIDPVPRVQRSLSVGGWLRVLCAEEIYPDLIVAARFGRARARAVTFASRCDLDLPPQAACAERAALAQACVPPELTLMGDLAQWVAEQLPPLLAVLSSAPAASPPLAAIGRSGSASMLPVNRQRPTSASEP